MKTTIEMHGFEIVIEETEEGVLTVSALKDGDVVEEFTLEGGEDNPEGEEGDEIKGFEEFGDEEEDFESGEGDDEEDFDDESGEGDDEESDDDDDDDDDDEEATLESFQSFINKGKKKSINKTKKRK